MNPYEPRLYHIAESKPLSETIQYLKLDRDLTAGFIPGQFLMVSLPGFGEAPLTPANPSTLQEPLELVVRRVGQLTDKLTQLKNGDEIYLRGPYGNGYPIEEMRGKDILIIGGGCGVIPLRSLILHLGEKSKYLRRLIILMGAKTPEEMIFHKEAKEWEKFAETFLIVNEPNKEWTGEKGVIINLIEKVENLDPTQTIVISCGPSIMYDFLAPKLLEKGIKSGNIYFSLERRMRCGIGLCQHCTCGKKYACVDGPVFSLTDVQEKGMVK